MFRVLRKTASIYAGGFIAVRARRWIGCAVLPFFEAVHPKRKKDTVKNSVLFETIRAAGLVYPAAVSFRSR